MHTAMTLSAAAVLKRSRADSLQRVKSLNLWGCNLTEVSLLKQLPNLEILNLSCNNLMSIRDLGSCKKLTELYIRRNQISDFGELDHLAALTNLQILWLSDNPISSEPGYRSRVIRILPQLTKLDNVCVTEEEKMKTNARESATHPSTKNNVLSAVLCLLQELDHSSLVEVQKKVDALLEQQL